MDLDANAWRDRIRDAAVRAGGGTPTEATVEALYRQVRAVVGSNERLHLTAIRDPAEYVERHLVESMLGVRPLAHDVRGPLLDLGSGNGYPGVPIAALRAGLEPWLAESNGRKATFLEGMLAETLGRGGVLHRHVERPADLGELPPLAAIVSRAMGGWKKILPRLAPALREDGVVLLWAGAEVEPVARRQVWKTLREVERLPLPHRNRAWIWVFRRTDIEIGCQITSVAPDSDR